MKKAAPKYPEHEKLKATDGKREAVQWFIDWLYDDAGLVVAESPHDDSGYLVPCYDSREKLMARHFGINLVKLDNEKRKMLDECRRMNARKSANG